MADERVMMHVDEFIDDPDTDAYASWFFNMKRMSAAMQDKFANIISKYKLYCDYRGRRWRVTGASRMGDVWLTENFIKTQYQYRVEISECSNFSNT